MNISSPDAIDMTTLVKVVRDGIDPALDIEYTEALDGDAEHTHADISKATELMNRRLTGYRRSIPTIRYLPATHCLRPRTRSMKPRSTTASTVRAK